MVDFDSIKLNRQFLLRNDIFFNSKKESWDLAPEAR